MSKDDKDKGGEGFAFLVMLLVTLVAGAAIGCCVILYNYAIALKNHVKLEKPTIMSTSTEPAIKSYFFGKGYHDLVAVITESWKKNLDSTKDFFSRINTPFAFLFLGGAGVSVIVFGTLFFVAVSLLHILFLSLFFLLIYIGFTIVWTIERTYLFFHGFFSVCPHCHEKSLLPEYICDHCGKIHSKLMPNSYGILFHQCLCGQKLPATFFLNRGRLQARCSHQDCHQLLHREHVESRKIFIPILGGPSAGKTAFMFAVVRQLVDKKAAEMGFNAEFVDSNTESDYRKIVNQLRHGAVPAKTIASIPTAFNLALKKGGKTRWFMYIYDPAGEAFQNTEELVAHHYYEYLSGMIMIIDPFSIPAVRRDYQNNLSRTSNVNPSQLNVEDALSRVLLTLEESFGLSKTGHINKPLAVVINKVDAFGLEELIGEVAVNNAMKTRSSTDKAQIRNDIIRQQLIDWDEGALIQQLDTRFKKVRYFSCSALGRIPDSKTKDDFVPYQVLEPMLWILNGVSYKEFGSSVSSTKSTAPPLGRINVFGRVARYAIVTLLVIIIGSGLWMFSTDTQLPPTPNESEVAVLPVDSQTIAENSGSGLSSSEENAPVGPSEHVLTENTNEYTPPPPPQPEPVEVKITEPAENTPIQFVRAYYQDINNGHTEIAIRKWLHPNEDKLRTLIKESEWVKINEINEVQPINQNAVDATLSIDVTGKQKSHIASQRWKGTIELAKVEGEWKISRMRLDKHQAVIYQENDTFHLGDEKIRRWKALHGDCFAATFFYPNHSIQRLTLKLDIWGSESRSNAIFLNGIKIATLPYQERRTRKWIKEQVVLDTDRLEQGTNNQLRICSGVTTEGDKDDLQIRKIQLIAE